MGKSVDLDISSNEELAFDKNVTVQNTEEREWAINPTISTEGEAAKGYFTGKSTLIVPAKGSA